MSISSINTNIAALAAQANIAAASDNASASIARLSSGNRIVKSSDDVAALAVGTSLQTQVTALKSALNNAAQGTSLLQVADGALSQINDILQQQKSLAIQAGSGTLSDTDRAFLNQEFQSLSQQIDQIAGSTNFNGVKLLNGGLGTSTTLANTDALSAGFSISTANASAAGTSANSTVAIQAFSSLDGSSLNGTASAGQAKLVASDGSTALTDSAYNSVNSAVAGKFTNWQISNVNYGSTGSATISANLNGVTFSGTVANNGTSIVLKNGSTNIVIKTTAINLTNAGTVQTSQTQLGEDFRNTQFERTSVIGGVDFIGTRLQGSVGAAATGVAMVRTADGSQATIGNFQLTQTGIANKVAITVNVNGHTLQATSIKDAVDGVNVATIAFDDGHGNALLLNLTGLDTAFTDLSGAGGDATQATAFINALNTGFSRAGGGLNFTIGSSTSDTLNVSLGSATTSSLFNGQPLSIGTAQDAATASSTIDQAVNSLTSIQSNVGALESRFNFATANLQSSEQNEDAARGALLDTDVASESTAYATSQVRLQAGIAVLAQANLLPQNLLKLIQ